MSTYSLEQFENLIHELEFICGGGIIIKDAHRGGHHGFAMDSAKDLIDEFNDKIKFIIDGGKCKIGLESTIIDLKNKPKILRQGFITSNKIYKILRKKILVSKKKH